MRPFLLALTLCCVLCLKGADPTGAFPRIDAHVHAGPPPAAFLDMLERRDARIINVTLIDPKEPGFDTPEPQTSMAAEISRQSRGRIAWVSTFDPAGFEEPGFADRAIRHLRSTFERGAIGVKIYKTIGLDLRTRRGAFVLPDDPAFAPVLEFIARQGATLMAHLGEPLSSWSPLDPADPNYSYYKNNPAWHLFLHPERPSHAAILEARDRMLAAHPTLRVIGCHLGSMEEDVDQIARRLDRYPNFAVDTAARTANLMRQPRDKVRAFLIRYQDRVLWGTDSMELAWKDPQAAVARWEAGWDREWKYYATDQGLALPAPVLHKIFHDNALHWFPRLHE